MDSGTLMAAVMVLPFLGALVTLASGRLGERAGWLALAFPVLAFASVLGLLVETGAHGQQVISWSWVPGWELRLSFLVDGLSILFGLLVTGIGALVVFYARYYFQGEKQVPTRFYAALLLFMGAMLATVFANHLLVLFIGWELTGLASFLLIGFQHEDEAARRGARMALLITSATGLCLLAGLVLLSQVGGGAEWSQLLRVRLDGSAGGTALAALVLMLFGAFGKSAQFPLHFWLPNAMTAPTPASAYLHSATMVKLGIFLVARLFPIFSDHELWPVLVSIPAFFTMMLGALLALVSQDLKAILAFSTVSQLGFLIGYYGLGSPAGVEHDFLHIVNHACYKGSLFMVAGIVIHATGGQDIRRLGGLWNRMPVVGMVCLVACATMAGMPGTTGFLSKELMFKEVFASAAVHDQLGWYAGFWVVAMSLIKVAFALRFFWLVFLGNEPSDLASHYYAPPPRMVIPPMVLAGLALLGGCFPVLLETPLHFLSVAGLHPGNAPGLALWHGWNRELAASLAVVVGGAGVFYWGQATGWRWARIPRWLQFEVLFEGAIERFALACKVVTRALAADRPTAYLPVALTFAVLLLGGFLASALPGADWGAYSRLMIQAQEWDWLRLLVGGGIAFAAVATVLLRRWTAQLIALSTAGFLTTGYYVLYRAPDLALTQILVETMTLFLVVLLLSRFPASVEAAESRAPLASRARWFNLAIALGSGTVVSVLTFLALSQPPPENLGTAFLEQTLSQAGGRNAVNTILLDFRGFDTLGEIAVLVVAVLGALGLFMRRKRSPEEYREGPLAPPRMQLPAEKEANRG